MKKYLFIFFSFWSILIFSQSNEYFIDAEFLPNERKIIINQTINFFNHSDNNLSHIILNDWPHSYSSSLSPLGQRLSEDFTLNFQRSTRNQKGNTLIKDLLIDDSSVNFNRINDNIDLIKIDLNEELKPNNEVSISITYEIKVQIDDFTGYGIDKNFNINLSEWFITLAKLKDGKWVNESNLDLNDLSLDPAYYNFTIGYPSNYFIISDLSILSKEENFEKILIKTKRQLKINNPIILSKTDNFRTYPVNKIKIITDLNIDKKNKSDSLVSKLIRYVDKKSGNNLKTNQNDSIKIEFILNKTLTFLENKLGNYPIDNLVLSEFDLKKNPIYGFNNIPEILSPYKDGFTYEINILKLLISQFLNNAYPFHKRVNYWEIKGIETFLLISYLKEYHSDVNLIGKFSNMSILKNREYSKYKFTDQFRLFDNIISSRNINQPIKTQLDSLTRVNYKIINPYKAGLSLSMLDDYLGGNELNKTLEEFSKINKLNSINYKSLLEILQSKYDLNWFDNYLKYNGNIDFSVKKIVSNNKSRFKVSNLSKIAVPTKITFKNDNEINSHWIHFKNDTILDPLENSQITVNKDKFFSESNFNNNTSFLDKSRKKIKFVLFNDFDDYKSKKINYMPLFNYNLYDGIMPGISFSNSSIIRKPFNYKIVPYFSTKQKEILGKFNLKFTDYNENKNSDLFSVDYFIGGSTFHYKENLSYDTFFPSILFTFRNSEDLRSNSRKYISLRYISVYREENTNLIEYPNYNILNLKFISSNSSVEKARNYKTDFQFNKEFIKLSFTYNYRKFYKNNRQYNVRFFAGKFLENNTKDDFFSFSTYKARDYLFSAFLLGRSENTGFYSQQYLGTEGGMKSKLENEFSNDLILSLNSGITIWQWIEAYGGFALIKNKNKKHQLEYESGLRLNILTDYFELYLPAYSSIGNEFNQRDYLSKIRFRISFDPKTLSSLISRRWF